jgi:hypothetical protein
LAKNIDSVKTQPNQRISIKDEKKPEVTIAPDVKDTAKTLLQVSHANEEKKLEVANIPVVAKDGIAKNVDSVKLQSNQRVAITEEKKPEVTIAPDIKDTLKKVVDSSKSSTEVSPVIEEKKPEVASTPVVANDSKENIIDNKKAKSNKRVSTTKEKKPEVTIAPGEKDTEKKAVDSVKSTAIFIPVNEEKKADVVKKEIEVKDTINKKVEDTTSIVTLSIKKNKVENLVTIPPAIKDSVANKSLVDSIKTKSDGEQAKKDSTNVVKPDLPLDQTSGGRVRMKVEAPTVDSSSVKKEPSDSVKVSLPKQETKPIADSTKTEKNKN